MTRDEFMVYIDHFNNKRYDKLVAYFTDDIVVTYFVDMKTGNPKPQVLKGPAAFVENYRHLHDTVEEKMELGKFITDGKNLYVDLWTEFRFKEDTPDFSAGPKKKGDVFVCTNFVLYDLDDTGKFKGIRIAHHRVYDPLEARL